jgi:hypothetical protein
VANRGEARALTPHDARALATPRFLEIAADALGIERVLRLVHAGLQ